MKKRPNVLFLLTDDQRGGTIHALGNDEIKTPNIDRLVQRGTSFVNAHIPGGTASAVCMPSRAMINSGKTLFHLEECGRNIPCDHVTMGQCFLQNGYHAMETGKWHNGIESFARSFDGGENIFFGGMWDHWNVPVNDFDATGRYEKEIQHFWELFSNRLVTRVLSKFAPHETKKRDFLKLLKMLTGVTTYLQLNGERCTWLYRLSAASLYFIMA